VRHTGTSVILDAIIVVVVVAIGSTITGRMYSAGCTICTAHVMVFGC
jgi:hypothetical protein